MGDKGEGGIKKNLKKWVTSFMDSPNSYFSPADYEIFKTDFNILSPNSKVVPPL